MKKYSGDVMKSILFVMSISGTTMLILQIIISLILKYFMSEKSKYFLLKSSIFFYLFPFPLFKNYYIDLFGKLDYDIFSLPRNKIYDTDVMMNFETGGDFSVSPVLKIIIVSLIIIYIIFMIVIIYHIILYFILKLRINNYSKEIYDEEIISILKKEKEKLQLKRNIIIKSSKYIDTPMTTGFFRPVILLPEKEIKKESLIWIFKHELVHIYNCDYMYMWLCIIVTAIHWYNPFVYLLIKRLYSFSEFNCDEFVIKGLNQKQCIKYGYVILEFSAMTNRKLPYKAVNMFGSYSKKIMKARLSIVKYSNKRKRNKGKSIVQAAVIISTMFISSLTVFAYKELEISPDNIDYFSGDFVEISSYSSFGTLEETEIKLPDLDNKAGITHYFIDEKGNLYKIDGNKVNENKEKVACNHTYDSGSYVVHKLNASGGCIMDYYNAQKCTKCGKVILGTKYNTVTYLNCPH